MVFLALAVLSGSALCAAVDLPTEGLGYPINRHALDKIMKRIDR